LLNKVYLLQNGEKFKENLSISSCVVHVMITNSNNQYMQETFISFNTWVYILWRNLYIL